MKIANKLLASVVVTLTVFLAGGGTSYAQELDDGAINTIAFLE